MGAGGRVVVESCSIFENAEHGILAHEPGSDLVVTRSRVSFNGGIGISLDGGGQAAIEDNDLRNNAKGSVVISATSQPSVNLGSNLT